MRAAATIWLMTVLAGCGSTAGSVDAALAPVDLGVVLSSALDAAVALAPDMAVASSACEYIDLATDQSVLFCGSGWVSVTRTWDLHGSPGCPDLYVGGGQSFATFALAATTLQCKTECVYVPGGAALAVRCGLKGETTRYVDGGPGQVTPSGTCEALNHAEFSSANGWYLDSQADAFWAMHPCP